MKRICWKKLKMTRELSFWHFASSHSLQSFFCAVLINFLYLSLRFLLHHKLQAESAEDTQLLVQYVYAFGAKECFRPQKSISKFRANWLIIQYTQSPDGYPCGSASGRKISKVYQQNYSFYSTLSAKKAFVRATF